IGRGAYSQTPVTRTASGLCRFMASPVTGPSEKRRLVMTVVTSRSDFEKLMVLRMKEAKLLLDQKDWDGAYYLAGYAVEFALKIRIISQLMKSNSFPDKKL